MTVRDGLAAAKHPPVALRCRVVARRNRRTWGRSCRRDSQLGSFEMDMKSVPRPYDFWRGARRRRPFIVLGALAGVVGRWSRMPAGRRMGDRPVGLPEERYKAIRDAHCGLGHEPCRRHGVGRYRARRDQPPGAIAGPMFTVSHQCHGAHDRARLRGVGLRQHCGLSRVPLPAPCPVGCDHQHRQSRLLPNRVRDTSPTEWDVVCRVHTT